MSGYMLRRHQAALAAAEKPCDACGHVDRLHLEREYGTPGYRPLLFACRADGCTCEIDRGANASVHRAPTCPECGHDLMPPEPEGQAGDDSYYCEGCGRAWSLDLRRVLP